MNMVHQVREGSFCIIHGDLIPQCFHKRTTGIVGPFHSAYIRHSYSEKIDKSFTYS